MNNLHSAICSLVSIMYNRDQEQDQQEEEYVCVCERESMKRLRMSCYDANLSSNRSLLTSYTYQVTVNN